MADRKSSSLLKLSLFVIGLLFAVWLSDLIYDLGASERIIAKCGEGNVQSFSTRGLFREEINCRNLP
jgi:hypothetical protein